MRMNKLVLKASAGTGKTYRLSLEYVVALLRGMDYKNILVMTFTKKATAEIKKEVLEKISNIIEIYKLIENNNENIKIAIENSNWDTKKKENYSILLANIEKLLEAKIDKEALYKLSLTYENILKNKENIKIYTIDAFLNIIFRNLVTNFLRIKNYTIIDEEENNYYYKKILENIFKDKKLFSDFREFFSENSEKAVDKYIDTIKKLIDGRWKYLISVSENQNFYAKEKLEIEKASYVFLKDIFNYIQNDCQKDLEDSLKKDYKKYIGKSDEEIKRLFLNDFKFILDAEPYNGNKFKKKDDVEHKENINLLYKNLKENLAKEIYNDILIPYEKSLMDLNKEIYKIYDELKIRERKFTFNDISVYTYMIIFNPDNLLLSENGLTESFFEGLDMQIDTVFIDEFQDTSILQWKILFEIIKKAKNIICVGDEKQSIYGWRGGEKKLFENLENIIDAKYENMDISYRSDINIVKYTNHIFNKISEAKPNWKFKNSSANSKENGYVKCVYIEKKKEEKTSLTQKLIEELQKTKLKNYSDIAIIARTNNDLKEIADLLEDEKIPYTLSTKKDLKELSGIFEYLELLKYLLYDRELSLFNFLASDLTTFGTDELEFLLKNKEKTLNFLNNLEDENFEKLLTEEIKSFLEKIKNLKKEYRKYNSQDLTAKIFETFNFLNIFNREFELKNLSEAYLLAKKYVNILELLNAYENNEIEFSENILKRNAIELMTIHKSKGLQFKTVFVLNKNENKRVNELDFIFSMDNNYCKVRFSLFVKNGYSKIVENAFKNEVAEFREMQEEEEINNLYVAITRAKNNLIILTENSDYLSNFEEGVLKYFDVEEEKIKENSTILSLKSKNLPSMENKKVEINNNKFSLQTEEKRMLGILIHYFLENIKYASSDEIEYAVKLCYKNYLSYFGEEKMKKIFSEKNINKILEIAGDIFSKKWDHIYSEYEIYDYDYKKSYRIDRIMIKDDTNNSGNGEIYIVDYKTGAKNDEQLENYKELLYKNFGDEIKNYKIKTKFLEFNIEY